MEFKEIENTLQDLSSLASEKLLLAHSGGVDSCVMAQILLEEKIPFSVAHCNFQLRDSASIADEEFVRTWCKQYKIPFFIKRFDTLSFKKEHKQSIQLAARTLRYQWFEELRNTHGFSVLLTAHHLNDQFETFFMHATRGTGISGLLGIQERDWIQRPLKNTPKAEILAYAQEHKIKWREDASNATDDYLRNEVRHQLLEPWLELHPESLTNFKTTLQHLTAANSFIQSQLDSLKKQFFVEQDSGLEIEVALLNQLPQKHFCIHHWFAPLGFSADEVSKLLQASKGKVLYSSTHRLIRERERLVLTTLKEMNTQRFVLDLSSKENKLPISLIWENVNPTSKMNWKSHQAALDKSLLKKPLCLRKYKKGDYFYPSGMNGKKLLSKFFKDEKYTILQKESQWLLCSAEAIVWVVGKRCDERFTAKASASEILLMQLEQ